jgi:hypothetical protein
MIRGVRSDVVLFVALAVAGVVALRPWGKPDSGDSLVVTEQDLAVVRQLPVIWSPAESGAPAVFDLSNSALPSVSTKAYRAAVRAAEVMIHLGELAPGRYEYESPLAPDELAHEPFVEHGFARVEGRRVVVEVTESQLKLLKATNTGVIDDGGRQIGVEINPKRPYGDMTFFELDMAEILGIKPEGPPRKDRPAFREFTEAQTTLLGALHEQTQPALQVLLQRGKLEPGRFVRQPPGYGRWQRAM